MGYKDKVDINKIQREIVKNRRVDPVLRMYDEMDQREKEAAYRKMQARERMDAESDPGSGLWNHLVERSFDEMEHINDGWDKNPIGKAFSLIPGIITIGALLIFVLAVIKILIV